jgi:histidyl-tRNA synthetase
MPAIGFAIGFDRLAELMAAQEIKRRTPDLFIAALGAMAQTQAFNWCCELAQTGVLAEMDMADRSLKSQMKRADRLGAAYTLIVGENELTNGQAALRNMQTKNQTDLPLAEMVIRLKQKLADR